MFGHDLAIMHMTMLFRKLRRLYELKLGRLIDVDEKGNKKKNIALKVDSEKMDTNSNNENLSILVKTISKLLRNKNISKGG